ncbi:MAG: 16S rRNA (uracil(1498)-N(3))-methyltransferase [Thermodesulfobacteriota bacterium]
MARTDSFHLPPDKWTIPFRLEGDEARHLSKVLRLGPGAVARLFDGRGREGLFRVESVKNGVTLELISESVQARPGSETWLALAWNKSTRRGWLLEKAVELGAAGILFWESSRGQGGMPDAPKQSWTAQLVAGAKQCANPWLPELEMVQGGIEGLIGWTAGFESRFLPWESSEATRTITPESLTSQGRRVFVIGPEGGLTGDEAARFASAGFQHVTLGPRPLRWETAALLCLGLCWWADNR